MSLALARRESAELRRTIHVGRHASGCEIRVAPTPGLSKTYALFTARYGSLANDFDDPFTGERIRVTDGIAHFLEHKLFELPDGGDVTDRFARLGATTNAYTWYTQTAYLFSTTEHAAACLDLLLDFVQEARFTPPRVEVEKGIIGQEIRMYDDDPYHVGFRSLLEALYQQHPARLDIAGSVASIAPITAEDLRRCHAAFYHPANMVLVVAGDVEPARIADAVSQDLDARRYPPSQRVRVHLPAEPLAPGTVAVERRVPIARPRLFVGVKEAPLGRAGPDLVRRDLATHLGLSAAFGRTSDAFARWYGEGLIDDSFGVGYVGEADFAFADVVGDTDHPERLRDAVFAEAARIARDGLPAADVDRTRRATLGRMLRSWDAPEHAAGVVLEYALHDVHVTDVPGLLAAVTPEEASRRVVEVLDPERHATSILRPT